MKASLYDLGDYPGARLISATSGEGVSGELYRLRDSSLALRTLDKYEEFFPHEPRKSLFVRKRVSVTLEDGRRKRAWAYFYNRAVAGAKPIPSGRFRDSDASRQSLLALGSNAR
jgi:gamma-glutamylcyclotransferase (GGCT)/AIG2-like uncharacterized protein YtfP